MTTLAHRQHANAARAADLGQLVQRRPVVLALVGLVGLAALVVMLLAAVFMGLVMLGGVVRLGIWAFDSFISIAGAAFDGLMGLLHLVV